MRRAAVIIVGAAVVVAGGAGTVLASERATVTLLVPAQKVEAKVTLTGSPGSGDLPTQKLSVKVTDTLAGSSSPATISNYAIGLVVFTFHSPCRQQCGGGPLVRVAAIADVSTAAGVHYTTLADTGVFSTTSPPIPVVATVAGPAGNTGAGTIVRFGSVPTDMTVTNPWATIGGSSRDSHVITESDFEAVERAVITKAFNDANKAMRAKAKGLGYALVGQPTSTEESSDTVGDETETFTITVTAYMDAVGFSDSTARSRIRSAVLAQVPSDQQRTRDSIETDYKIDRLTAGGDVTVTGTGVAFVIPKISTQSLQWRIASMDVGRASVELRQDVPGAAVRIQVWPAGMSRLPVLPGNITFKIEVLPAPA
jgi:hypothetical protein